ncbi:MAG: OmpA family protein [Alphaproteobacteria bacterium]|nr:OmpA family protein [Alphaproteobacteria bacterium]MBL6952767.1 OmpA family protein [Alphaproteobacteria bacterium]
MNGQIAEDHGVRTGRGSVGRRSGRLTALVLTFALAGCAQTPDWVNPVNWFDGMFDDMFSENVDQLPPAPKTSATTPGADKPFPKLSQTQMPSNTGTSAEEREKLANSLIADRDNAKYTDQDLRAGNQRLAAAPPPPPPPRPTLVPTAQPMAKQTAPERIKDVRAKKMAAVPVIEGTAARSAAPSLPAAPARIAGDSDDRSGSTRARGLSQLPSIVQRRGAPPPPPTPIAEASRRPIPQIVEKSNRAKSGQQLAGMAALPQPPVAVSRTSALPSAPALVKAPAAPTVARPVAPGLTPPPVQAVARTAAQGGAVMAPSVQVNLPLGQDQSILAQTFSALLAAQNSPVVSQPGNVFYASNATPIGGQWATNVPGVVQQAFNAALNDADRDVQSVRDSMIASPQMSNDAMRRLPGAPGLIRFGHGSIRLSGKEKKYLRGVAEQVRRDGKMIYVVGHASQRTGDMNYAKHKLVNFNLSLDRANIVARELRRRGVARDRIVVQAKGDTEPLYFEFMPDGESQNRRVEVYVR